MDTTPAAVSESTARHELHALRDNWWWFLALGVALVVLGTIAIGSAVLATVAATILFGFLLVAGGISLVVSSFWAGRWSGMLLTLLIGILYIVVGFMIVDCPVTAAVQLTLIAAIFFIITGVIRIVYALSERFTNWGWVLLNGAVTLLLGLLVYKQWPNSGLWLIGLYVGIEMIFNGWGWIMLSLGLRQSRSHA